MSGNRVAIDIIWKTHDDFIIFQQFNLFLYVCLAGFGCKSLVNKQLKLIHIRRTLLHMLTIVKGLLKWPLLIFLLVYHISKVRMVRLWFSLNEWLLLWKPRDSNRIARCLYCVHIIIVWLQFLRWFLIGWIPWALRVNWLLWSVWLLSLISLIYIGFQLALVLLIIFLLFSIWAVHFLVSTWFGSILLL